MVFLYVIEHTMLPLFTLVLIGFLVDRKFHLQVGPLSKFMFYLVIPCFIFTNIYTTEFPDNSLRIIACLAIFMVFGYIHGFWLYHRPRRQCLAPLRCRHD